LTDAHEISEVIRRWIKEEQCGNLKDFAEKNHLDYLSNLIRCVSTAKYPFDFQFDLDFKRIPFSQIDLDQIVNFRKTDMSRKNLECLLKLFLHNISRKFLGI
jgi:hypothetical protein